MMWRQRVGIRLRWKIVVPYGLLAVLFALFGAIMVTRLVVGSLSERFTNQLVEAARVAADSVVRQERDHLRAIRTIAFTEGLPAALAARRLEEVRSIALSGAANQNAHEVEVLDETGRRVVGLRADGTGYVDMADTLDRSAWPFVRNVLSGIADPTGNKFAGVVETDAGHVLYSSGPVQSSSGTVVGAVLVGTDLTSFVRFAKSHALADIVLYDTTGVPLATTFAIEVAGEGHSIGSLTRPTPIEAGARGVHTISDREYELFYSPLRVRGERWGWYAVALPRSFIASSAVAARGQLAWLFAAGTLGVLLTGWLLARSLTHPLVRLVRTAEAVSRGDLTARSGVRGSDEIGELANAFDHMTSRLERHHFNTLSALVSAIDARDAYTRGHSVRVGRLAADLGRAMSLTSAELQHLHVGGMLHDIGKIGVRDTVLLKPGQLTPEERASIQEHPTIGLSILEAVELPPEVLQGVGGHHERINGTGYPSGLSGDALTLYPRIISVADVYDALITDRPYRAALELEQVLRMLDEEVERGLLDPDVVRAMHRAARQWETRRRNDRTLEGFMLEPTTSAGITPLIRLIGA